MRKLAGLGVLLLALVCGGACLAATISFPPLTGRVVDQVGVLSDSAKQQLTQELAAEEQRSGNQVVVAIVKSLQGQAIEDYGYQLGRSWGIGQKDKNNGAILLVAPSERKVRIEVGYGLEGTLTDAQSAMIIHQIILPKFKQGQMQAGIVAGAEAILHVLDGDAAISAQEALPTTDNRSLAAQESDASSPHQLIVGGLFVFIWILFLILSLRRRSGFFFLPMGGFGGGGFSGGGGGFSGGGGSFGGGGASGSW